MPGFKLRRLNQTVAIDTDYFNLALRQTGRVRTASSGQENPYVRRVTFTVDADQPILAVRAPYPVCITHSVVNGGQVTYTLYGIPDSAIDFDVDFWLFDLPKYGMMFASAGKFIVRNPATREPVFDSRMKYLKVQDFFLGNSNSDETRNYGKYPAVVLANRAWAYIVQPMNQQTTRIESLTSMVWTDGNSVKCGSRNIYYMVRQYSSNDRAINYNGGNRQIMVVDVENY